MIFAERKKIVQRVLELRSTWKASSDCAEQNRTTASFLRQEGREAESPGSDATRRDGDDGDGDARTLTVKPLKSMDFAGSGTRRCPVSCGSGLSRARGMPGVIKAS